MVGVKKNSFDKKGFSPKKRRREKWNEKEMWKMNCFFSSDGWNGGREKKVEKKDKSKKRERSRDGKL